MVLIGQVETWKELRIIFSITIFLLCIESTEPTKNSVLLFTQIYLFHNWPTIYLVFYSLDLGFLFSLFRKFSTFSFPSKVSENKLSSFRLSRFCSFKLFFTLFQENKVLQKFKNGSRKKTLRPFFLTSIWIFDHLKKSFETANLFICLAKNYE